MEKSTLTFAQPLWFIALALIPLVAALYFWSQKRSEALIAKVVAPRLRSQLAGAVSIGRRTLKAVLILAVIALVTVALARPQMGFVEKEIKQRGRDVIIAIDTSRSMLATDVSPTRLARAKLVAQDLLRLVRGDRVGLVAFAGSAFLQAPLTVDYNAVLVSLDELDTTVIPKGGTNIAAAIRTAEEAFGKGEGQSRALVILTDGEELDADGIAAAKKAAALGLRIFTVGVGSREGSLIPLHASGAGSDFVRDSSGKPVQSKLDETRLREIAEASGGFYEPMSPDVARTIFDKGIVPMDMKETGVASSRQPVERYQWPLGGAIALMMVWFVLGDRRRQPVTRKVVQRTAVAASILLGTTVASMADTGMADYQAGNYDKAMASFEKGLKDAPQSEKLQFNAGAAAYKSGDFAKAVDHFTSALLAKDRKLHEDAAYNLGNSLVRRGEAAQGKEEKKADWKNAIQHYTEALNIDPKNKQAEENRDVVKKMLEDLEKQEKQEQQKDQQDKQDKKDQKDQKDQKQDQQKNDQQQKDQQDKQDKSDQQKDQQQNQNGQSGQDKKDQQKQDQKKDDAGQDQKDPKKQNGDQQKQDEKKDGKGDQKDQSKPPEDKGDEKKDQGEQGMAKNDQPKNGNKGDKPEPAPQPTPGEKKQGDLKTGEGEQKEEKGEQGQGMAQAEPAEKEGEMNAAQAMRLLNSLRSEEQRVQLMKNPQTEETLKDW